MLLIADVFPKLRSPENVVDQISKKSRSRGTFEKQHVKGDQTLLKSEPHHLYYIHWSLWRQLSILFLKEKFKTANSDVVT